MWKVRTAPSSPGRPRARMIDFPPSRPTWSVRRWTSSWQRLEQRPRPPSKRPGRFRSSCHSSMIPWEADSSPALRPGGNVTGLTIMAPDLMAKRLELLKEVVPKLSRVALLQNPDNPASAAQLREAEAAARASRVQPQTLEARNQQEIEGAFAAMIRERAGALLILSDAIFFTQRRQIAELAAKGRLPSIIGTRDYPDAGGLMAYG